MRGLGRLQYFRQAPSVRGRGAVPSGDSETRNPLRTPGETGQSSRTLTLKVLLAVVHVNTNAGAE